MDIFEDTAKESFLVDQVGAVAEEKCGAAMLVVWVLEGCTCTKAVRSLREDHH